MFFTLLIKLPLIIGLHIDSITQKKIRFYQFKNIDDKFLQTMQNIYNLNNQDFKEKTRTLKKIKYHQEIKQDFFNFIIELKHDQIVNNKHIDSFNLQQNDQVINNIVNDISNKCNYKIPNF